MSRFPWLDGIVDDGLDWAGEVAELNNRNIAWANDDVSLGQQIYGAGEAAVQMGSEFAQGAGAGMAGLGVLGAELVRGNSVDEAVNQAADTVRRSMEDPLFAFQVDTPEGKRVMQTLEKLEQPIVAGSEMLAGKAADAGHPGLATAIHTGGQAAGEMLLGKGLGMGGNAAMRLGDRAIDEIMTGSPSSGSPQAQEGAIKIFDEPGPKETYDMSSMESIEPRQKLYESPQIDESEASSAFVPNQPRPDRGDEPGTFLASVPEAMRNTNRKTGSKEDWLKDFSRLGVTEAELRFNGVIDALNKGGDIPRGQVIDAYNSNSAQMESWITGGPTESPVPKEVRQASDDARVALRDANTELDELKRNRWMVDGAEGNIPGMENLFHSMVAKRQGTSSDQFRNLHEQVKDIAGRSGIPLATIEAAASRMAPVAERYSKAVTGKEDADEAYRAGEHKYFGQDMPYGTTNGGYTPGNAIYERMMALQVGKAALPGQDVAGQTEGHSIRGALDDPDWTHAGRIRMQGAPVFSDPVTTKDGDQYRNVASLVFEGQFDSPQKLDLDKPDNQYGGLRQETTPAMLEDMNVRKDQIIESFRKLKEEEPRGRGKWGGKNAVQVYHDWPDSIDNVLEALAMEVSPENARIYSPVSTSPEQREIRNKMVQSLRNPDSEARKKLDALADERGDPRSDVLDKVVFHLETIDDYHANSFNFGPYDRKVSKLKNEYNEIESGANPTAKYLMHENMPFTNLSTGRRERVNAIMGASMEEALAQGNEYMAIIPQRMHGEVYAKAYGSAAYGSEYTIEPDAESMKRFHSGAGGGRVWYDEDRGDYYTRDENGDMEVADVDNIPEDIRDEIDRNSPSREDWEGEARDAYEEQEGDRYFRENYTHDEGWTDADGDRHSDSVDAYDANKDIYDRDNGAPDESDFETEAEYEEAIEEYQADRQEWADENRYEFESWFRDNDYTEFETEDEARMDSSEDMWNTFYEHSGDYELGEALGEHWDDRLEGAGQDVHLGEPVEGWDDPLTSPIRDPERSEWNAPPEPVEPTRSQYDRSEDGQGQYENSLEVYKREMRRHKENYVVKTRGAADYYRDDTTVTNQKRFLRNLGLTPDEIREAMTDIDVGVGWGDRTSSLGPRKIKVRAIKLTDAVKQAWENRSREGGLFGRSPMPTRERREQRATERRKQVEEIGNRTMDSAQQEAMKFITNDIKGSKPEPMPISKLFWDEEDLFGNE